MIDRINDIIDSMRPFINQDGGDLEFVKYENKVIHIKLLGSCIGCNLVDVTYVDGLLSIIQDEIPEIENIEIVE
jgi:Fe-S cluster biogenesis protein NfuA